MQRYFNEHIRPASEELDRLMGYQTLYEREWCPTCDEEFDIKDMIHARDKMFYCSEACMNASEMKQTVKELRYER